MCSAQTSANLVFVSWCGCFRHCDGKCGEHIFDILIFNMWIKAPAIWLLHMDAGSCLPGVRHEALNRGLPDIQGERAFLNAL